MSEHFYSCRLHEDKNTLQTNQHLDLIFNIIFLLPAVKFSVTSTHLGNKCKFPLKIMSPKVVSKRALNAGFKENATFVSAPL